MKLTTISTLGVVVALAAASLLPGNYGLAEEASVMGAARAKNETGAESTGANTTASFNATAVDLLSDVSVFLVVGYVLLEATCLSRGGNANALLRPLSRSLTHHIIFLFLYSRNHSADARRT